MTEPTPGSTLAIAATAHNAQRAIAAAAMREAAHLWRLLDPKRLDATFPGWLRAMSLLARNYHAQSVQAAAVAYADTRETMIGTPPRGLIRRADAPDEQWVARAFGYSGPGLLNRDVARPGTALSTTLGTTARIVQSGGRDTTIVTVRHDTAAIGWYRVTDGQPCAFCALLASRGIAYKSQRNAEFKTHNDCGCIAAPAFTHDQELPALNVEAADVYRSRGSGDAVKAFRRAWAERQDTPPGGGGGEPPDGPDTTVGGVPDPAETARVLDDAYRPWMDTLPADQRRALTRWQGVDRYYQQVQRAVRSGDGTDQAVRDVVQLDAAVNSGALPVNVISWRGVRSTLATFGVPADELGTLIDQTVDVPGFLASSLDEAIAREQFTRPPLAGGPALLRLRLTEGTQAAWVAPIGAPALRDQLELLLGPAHSLRITAVTYSDGIAIVDAEVI